MRALVVLSKETQQARSETLASVGPLHDLEEGGNGRPRCVIVGPVEIKIVPVAEDDDEAAVVQRPDCFGEGGGVCGQAAGERLGRVFSDVRCYVGRVAGLADVGDERVTGDAVPRGGKVLAREVATGGDAVYVRMPRPLFSLPLELQATDATGDVATPHGPRPEATKAVEQPGYLIADRCVGVLQGERDEAGFFSGDVGGHGRSDAVASLIGTRDAKAIVAVRRGHTVARGIVVRLHHPCVNATLVEALHTGRRDLRSKEGTADGVSESSVARVTEVKIGLASLLPVVRVSEWSRVVRWFYGIKSR